MKKISIGVGLALLFLVFIAPQSASAIGIEVAAGIGRQDPSGDIGYKGEQLSVVNDLKYDAKNNIFGRAKIDMPLFLPNIYLMATPSRFEGDGNKSTSFTFGDKTFSANVPFTSKLRLDHYDFALFYGIPGLKLATLGMLNVEAGLNVRIIDFKGEISQASTGISESKSLALPIPMVYLGAQFKPVKFLSLEAEARGIAYSSNYYYDLIGRVKVSPIGPVFIAGGYRYETVKIDQSDVKVNLNFGGPFVELGFVF